MRTSRKSAVIVAHQYWPTPGPASLRLGALVEALSRRDYDVEVWVSSDRIAEGESITGQHGETVLAIHSSTRDTGISVSRLLSLWRFAHAIRRTGRKRKKRIDLVITDPPPSAALAAKGVAARHGSAFVYYLCDSWGLALESRTGFVARAASRVFKMMELSALRGSSAVLAVTGNLFAYARRARPRTLIQLENGVDLSRFTPDTGIEVPPGVDATKRYLVYAGTAGVVHGATIFADAAEHLWARGEDFQLVFVGTGQDMDILADRADSSLGTLVVLPPVAPERVAAILRGAVASLVSLKPSTGYIDARPTKALASIAVGTPIVYVGEGPFRDAMARAELGYFADWTVESAAEAMRSALYETQNRESFRARLAQYARDHFDQGTTLLHALDRIEHATGLSTVDLASD